MSAKKTKTGEAPSKVFDVAKPGKSAPSATSRPVIITNRPVLKDPMVVASDEEEQAAPAVAPPSLSKPGGRLVIQPLSEDDASAGGSAEAVKVTVAAKTADKPEKDEAAATPATDETAKEAAADTVEKAEAATSVPVTIKPAAEEKEEKEEAADKPAAAPASQPPATKSEGDPTATAEELDDAAKAAAEYQAALQKLVEKRTYFLPINAAEKRKVRQFLIAGIVLAVVLGLAWLDVALDSGMVHIQGVKAVTHFFTR